MLTTIQSYKVEVAELQLSQEKIKQVDSLKGELKQKDQ